MKIDVKLEKSEDDALEVISTAKCNGISCAKCPLDYHSGDYSFCIKGACQTLLEVYRNKEVQT